uniref:Helitron helicase-like domain-containing protein n=2 Tax=Octopus bimaculoides TaxID=37653 RepID=A0A0L8HXF6_OCTBM
MAIVRIYGPPDIFLTITCDPNWQEIRENLLPGQTSSDRLDLVACVFNIKLHELLNDIIKKHIFRRINAYCYTIEFQKRGLPHAHLLIILHPDDKLDDPERINQIVCVEVPDPVTEPLLHETVKRCMIHGPCGNLNPAAPCMENNKCLKEFPKVYQQETRINPNCYPLRRRGVLVRVRNHAIYNRYAVSSMFIFVLRFVSSSPR